MASLFGGVVSQFADEIGDRPRLGEFLEIIGWAVPTSSPAVGEVPSPLVLRARLTSNRNYRDPDRSRVGELNDPAFVLAGSALQVLTEQIATATGRPASADELAIAIHRVLREEGPSFADMDPLSIASLTVADRNRASKPKVGDMIAIPVSRMGYRTAVVVARDRFGTALGLFLDSRWVPTSALDPARARPQPVYTDDARIVDGTWPVVGHDKTLLAAFPNEPAIYHAPDLTWPGIRIGPFGSAETARGVLRDLTEQEAHEVGLLNGTYRQIHMANDLQQRLSDGVL
jgi:hypothetical protein